MESVMGSVAQFVEERLDDSVENLKPGEHLLKGAKNAIATAFITPIKECAIGVASHTYNEIGNSIEFKKALKKNDVLVNGLKKRKARGRIRHKNSIDKNEHLINWRDSRGSATYQHLDADEPSTDEPMTPDKVYEESDDEPDADEPEDVKVKYVSEGYWFSKMIVSYFVNEDKTTQEVIGSGKFVTVPSTARRVEVRFQVRRPVWGDVIKYDRFQKRWYQPSQPHVFRYDTPRNRTFTISGNLWWEAVTHVSNEQHDEMVD